METIWDDKKVKKLQELLGKGLSTSEIGKKLGVSKNTIIGKVHRLKQANELTVVKAPAKKDKSQKKEKNLFSFSFSSKRKKESVSSNKKQNKSAKETKRSSEILIKEKVVIEQNIEIIAERFEAKHNSRDVDVIDEKKSVSSLKSNEKRYQLRDLKIDMCRWAYGEPNSSNFFFCGDKTFKNKPYCLKHSEMAYVIKKNNDS